MSDNVSEIIKQDSLVKLIQKEYFVGWVYSIDYDTALVITNDKWKENVKGIPHNSFLVATFFDPDNFKDVDETNKEVVLLRVVGSCQLPQDKDIISTKIDKLQEQESQNFDMENNFDHITQNLLQFGGLECSILGTFYKRDDKLTLGSDLESFSSSASLTVYRPRGEALETIVNHINPLKKQKIGEDANRRGLTEAPLPFTLGTVRFTSTDRLHRSESEEKVPFKIQPADFLARRTAVLGMTRTGKSNTIKHTVSVVKRIANEGGINIGQLIYDVNGEYANPNIQDEGALSTAYEDTICYRLFADREGIFRGILNNFYTHLNDGFSIIRRTVEENYSGSQPDVMNFLGTSFDEPPQGDYGERSRWKVRVAAYKVLLHRAGFDPGDNDQVKFRANEDVRQMVSEYAEDNDESVGNPNRGITLDEAYKWFKYAREIEDNEEESLLSSSGGSWFDEDTLSMIRMIVQRNSDDRYITGYQLLSPAKKYHDPKRDKEIGEEIYSFLKEGKIVILDLSVGDPDLCKEMGEKIAFDIFKNSMNKFINNETPPAIVIYIEEAHNYIGKKDELTDTWPRIAKEGAKFEISLVYATQEVSSIHPNILANTENWFVSHINNKRELKELTKFYDFEDFSRSLLRADDVGFARVKTLSSPFVVPVQINKFEPNNV